jgi:hypothetical protein
VQRPALVSYTTPGDANQCFDGAVEVIGATTTKTGLKVACVLDERTYEKGIKVSDAEMAALGITGDTFHPEWNYTIKPRHG